MQGVFSLNAAGHGFEYRLDPWNYSWLQLAPEMGPCQIICCIVQLSEIGEAQ